MMRTHPNGWNQTRELCLTLFRPAYICVQQLEHELPLNDRKAEQKGSFSACLLTRVLRWIMLQETSGPKQQWGLNVSQANA